MTTSSIPSTSSSSGSSPSTSSLSSLPALSAPGIGSSLDVNAIVSQLMAVEQQPVLLLDAQEADYQSQLTAYGNLKSALSTFQTAMQGLSSATQYQGLTATPSNTGVLTATADTTASPGSYSINVSTLAQAQSIYAAGQTSTTAAIGSGATTTLTFNFGTISGGTLSSGVYSGATFTQDPNHASATVTIDSSNNTLQGIANAINAANIGVTASIVNDGSASPYHLVLTSNATGANESMQISVSGDSTLQSLLSYDPSGTQDLTQSSAAQNAALTVNGIGITGTTNQVSGALPGVTLNLAQTGSTTLAIADNTSSVQTAVQSFVSAYNTLQQTIANLTAYDPTTQTGSILLGDPTALNLQQQLRSLASGALTGSASTLNSLSALGVQFQSDGTLSVDSTTLQNALTSNFSSIASLFAQNGTATGNQVQYVGASTNTQPGSYAVNVTQLATQGTVTGSAAAGLTITTGSNDNLALTVNGVSTAVTLPAGTYTVATLATELQTLINNDSTLQSDGIGVAVSQSGGVLTITSNSYGSSSSVSVDGGDAATGLFGASPTSTSGVDVAGTIGGIAATGAGQTLTGGAGTAVDGLQVSITGGATGARGTVNYSEGYAYQLSQFATSFLASDGPMAAVTNGVNQSIQDITNQINDFNQRMTVVQQNYYAEFNALDTMLSSMNSTSSFLTQQLSQISANTPKG